MTHTPGPWSISTDGEATGVIYALRGFEWDDICVLTPRCEAADNAHLIAAAPEMLAVLEELRESSTCCGTYDLLDETTWASPDLADRIESAIKKARGEE